MEIVISFRETEEYSITADSAEVAKELGVDEATIIDSVRDVDLDAVDWYQWISEHDTEKASDGTGDVEITDTEIMDEDA